MLQQIYSTIANRFELILQVNTLIFLIIGTYYLIALMVPHLSVKNALAKSVKISMVGLIIIGQVWLFIALGYAYYISYEPEAEAFLKYEEQFESAFHFSNTKTPIYFFENNEFKRISPAESIIPEVLFKSETALQEYIFSPNGQNILVRTLNGLYLIDRRKGDVTSIIEIELNNAIKGSLNLVRWHPDSNQIAFKQSLWSSVQSVDRFYIYDVDAASLKQLKLPVSKYDNVYWAPDGKALQIIRSQYNSDLEKTYRYDLFVHRYNLDSKEWTRRQILLNENELDHDFLLSKGIEFYDLQERLTFDRFSRIEDRISAKGRVVGINEFDQLYVVTERWFEKKVLTVPREPNPELPEYAEFGNLVFQEMKWLPGGKFVIINDLNQGLLILDPLALKIGLLYPGKVSGVGWFKERSQELTVVQEQVLEEVQTGRRRWWNYFNI